MQHDGAVDEVYLAHCKNYLSALESAFAALSESPETGRHAAFKIQQAVVSIKSTAANNGFELAGDVASSLYDFLENDYVEGDANHVLVIQKHIETLKTIFTRLITGNGGETGKAITLALASLIKKFEV